MNKELYENTIRSQFEMINKLNERIDEAIEFIKENAKYDITINQCRNKLFDFECDDLLNILGGKE